MEIENIKSAKYHHMRNPDDLTEVWNNNKIVFTMNDGLLVCYTKTFAEDANANPDVANWLQSNTPTAADDLPE
jgi:hypothetical protein